MDQKSNSLRARGHLGKLVGFPGFGGNTKNEPKIVKKNGVEIDTGNGDRKCSLGVQIEVKVTQKVG